MAKKEYEVVAKYAGKRLKVYVRRGGGMYAVDLDGASQILLGWLAEAKLPYVKEKKASTGN